MDTFIPDARTSTCLLFSHHIPLLFPAAPCFAPQTLKAKAVANVAKETAPMDKALAELGY